MKTLLYLIMMLSVCNVFSKKTKCKVKINFTNFDSTDFVYLQDNGIILYENYSITKKSGSVCLKIDKEPIDASLIINNDIAHVKTIWLHMGNFSIDIDVKNKKLKFHNSKINTDYRFDESLLDSIMTVREKLLVQKVKDSNDITKKDSIQKIIQNNFKYRDSITYEKSFERLNSYITLHLITTSLLPNASSISKEKLRILFNKLNPHLYKYKSYKDCKAIFELKEDPKLTVPIWNSNKN